MKLRQLSLREQILFAAVISIFILGLYVGLRFMPAYASIDKMQERAVATEQKLFKTRMPDEPIEDLDTIEKNLSAIEQTIAIQESEVAAIESQLAPFNSPELKVRVSQLARQSRIQIRVNEPLKQPSRLSNSPQKPNLNKPSQNKKTIEEQVPPVSASWIEKLSEQSLFHRPIQRIELEGDYQSIQQFIYGLDQLPWKITILRMKIDKLPNLSPYGYNQTLIAELVLAL